jgi:carbon storage regulator
MLVLSRKLNQAILIGDNIEIVVVDIGHGKIRLGISAPREIPVQRTELLPRDHEAHPDNRRTT